MSVILSEEMADFVQRRLAAILRMPDGWGPPHAVELQILLLLEMGLVVSGAERPEVDGLMDRYARFLARKLPGPPSPLAIRLGLTDRADERFTETLREFILSEQARSHATIGSAGPALPLRDQSVPPHFVAEV